MSKNVTVQSGVGLPGLLFITFLVLKLTGVITWSWLWVTAPLWLPFVVFLVIMAVVGLIALLAVK